MNATPPLTVLQVGEGRFLRAFLGPWLAEARAAGRFHGRTVLTAPRPGGGERLDALRARGGRYRVVVRGPEGERTEEIAPYDAVCDAFREPEALLREVTAPVPLVVVSNTTEAGLAYRPQPRERPETYPARLASWLAARRAAGVTAPAAAVPCELVAGNAALLRDAVRHHADDWGLPGEELVGGAAWVETLVDRIVTSEDADDPLACFTEPFAALYLGGAPDWLRAALPIGPAGVHWVADVTPARERKVRLLNGTHTLMAVLGLPLGCRGVREALEHAVLGPFLRAALFEDGVGSFPASERHAARAFAEETLGRFENPGVRDTLERLVLQLSAKVAARWTPILEGCRLERGAWPERFALGLAAYLRLAAAADPGLPDLALVDDAEWVGWLRGAWRPDDPEGFVVRAAAAPAWPAPRDPVLLCGVATQLRGIGARGLAACIRSLT